MSSSIELLKIHLKSLLILDPYRYFHSLLVLDISLDIAEYHSIENISDLQVASLMHDMVKDTDIQTAEVFAKQYNEDLPSIYKDFPKLLHGFLASLKLKHEWNIQNQDILEAVEFHSTGKSNWNTLGLILYIADFLASIHQYKPVFFFSIYQIAQTNLYQACYEICISKIEYLQQRDAPIHPLSKEFSDWLALMISSA